jgi:hypothetical protein
VQSLMAAVRGLAYTLRNSLYLSCTNQSSALSLLASRGPGFKMPTESGFCPLPDEFEPTAHQLFAVGTSQCAVLHRCRPRSHSPTATFPVRALTELCNSAQVSLMCIRVHRMPCVGQALHARAEPHRRALRDAGCGWRTVEDAFAEHKEPPEGVVRPAIAGSLPVGVWVRV